MSRNAFENYDEEARVGDALRARTYLAPSVPGAVDVVLVKGNGRVATRARVGLAPPGALHERSPQ